MMGFGFVVARFGLFLREVQVLRPNEVPQPVHLSQWFGIGLVLMGVVVNIAAAANHVRLVRRLQNGLWTPSASGLAIASAAFLAATGIAVAAYLLVTR